jgi:hypothetical protein
VPAPSSAVAVIVATPRMAGGSVLVTDGAVLSARRTIAVV